MPKNSSRGRFTLFAIAGGIALAAIALFAGALSSQSDPTPTILAATVPSATTAPATVTPSPQPTFTTVATTRVPATATLRPSSTTVPTFTDVPVRMATIDLGGGSNADPSKTCCKVCGSDSQACGDSCISKSKTCHKAPGCACQ